MIKQSTFLDPKTGEVLDASGVASAEAFIAANLSKKAYLYYMRFSHFVETTGLPSDILSYHLFLTENIASMVRDGGTLSRSRGENGKHLCRVIFPDRSLFELNYFPVNPSFDGRENPPPAINVQLGDYNGPLEDPYPIDPRQIEMAERMRKMFLLLVSLAMKEIDEIPDLTAAEKYTHLIARLRLEDL